MILSCKRSFRFFIPVGLFIALFAYVLVPSANGQVNEGRARMQAVAQFTASLNLHSTQPLDVKRREDIEEIFAAATGTTPGTVFFFEGSPKVPLSDGDFDCFVAVTAANGKPFSIKGFGLANSFSEFNRMLEENKPSIVTQSRAQAIADLYLAINPENRSLNLVSSLLDLKQAAERQCQTFPVDPDEKAFEAWWKHAKPMYADANFTQSVIPNHDGYLVDWFVLSSPSATLCGGAPLKARLEVGKDGHVGKLSFAPLRSEGSDEAVRAQTNRPGFNHR